MKATPDGGRYVLDLAPKTRNKFLYRAKIWVDAKDFAVVRIKGEPGKNPSLWIKRTDIEHSYVKVGDFWLPAENRTESVIRLGGVANLSIEYKNYRILRAEPLPDGKADSETSRIDAFPCRSGQNRPSLSTLVDSRIEFILQDLAPVVR